ncbi:short Calcium-binding Mitochondrial Carrier [Brevipalpus obovatus]|uniref:short Calcium-binding Mitochondrial Carrier n=1 Tax=Brevipalpus obovatus TaxID=246614 RepID=UPI003D9EAF49
MSQLKQSLIDSSLVKPCDTPLLSPPPPIEEGFQNNRWKHFLAGAVAGAASRTISAPFDRMKVLLQVQGAQLENVRKCYRHMLTEGGTLSLWRGNGINVLKIAPELAFKFMFYDEIKLIIQGSTCREINLFDRIISGSMAGALSQTLIYPMEVLKTRLCLRRTGQYKGLIDAVQKIYRAESMKAFYKGYLLNILGIIPYAGIDLAIYETLKSTYITRSSDNATQPRTAIYSVCGIISSSIGVSVVYPLALLRTRLQAQACHDTLPVMVILRNILESEGYLGLYRGIVATYMKVVPAVGVSYFVYEYTIMALGTSMS